MVTRLHCPPPPPPIFAYGGMHTFGAASWPSWLAVRDQAHKLVHDTVCVLSGVLSCSPICWLEVVPFLNGESSEVRTFLDQNKVPHTSLQMNLQRINIIWHRSKCVPNRYSAQRSPFTEGNVLHFPPEHVCCYQDMSEKGGNHGWVSCHVFQDYRNIIPQIQSCLPLEVLCERHAQVYPLDSRVASEVSCRSELIADLAPVSSYRLIQRYPKRSL